MGSLALPPAGEVYLDAQCVIYSVEQHAVFAAPLALVWQAVQAGQLTAATSELTILEALVGPLKAGDAIRLQDFEDLFRAPGVRLIPITPDILRAAARLRAAVPKFRTPDAIHAATSQAAGCALFVTNDFAFRGVAGLNVAVLHDVLAAP